MKRRILWAVTVAAFLLQASPAYSVEFAPVGSESISMGGAGVALAAGGYAPYYNPALLAEYRDNVDVELAASTSIRNVNLAKYVDELSDLDITTSISDIAQDPVKYVGNISSFMNVMFSIPSTNGLQVMPGFNLGCQVKQFGIGFYTVSDATATAVIDQAHNQIIIKTDVAGGTIYTKYDPSNPLITIPSNQAEYESYSIEYALENNLDYIDLTGLAYVEIPISGGYQFNTGIGKIDVGGSLKVMPGYTLDRNISINTSSGDIASDLTKDLKNSVSWGIDLGVLYKPKYAVLDKLAVGLVGKNLNTPQFKTSSSGNLSVKPMARIGAAYGFLNDMLLVALDADLTNNETYIPGYYSQYIGGGLNFKPVSWFSVRAGLMQNMRQSDEGLVLTGGLGMGPKWLQIDLSGFGSFSKASYKGSSFPEYAKVQLGISSKW